MMTKPTPKFNVGGSATLNVAPPTPYPTATGAGAPPSFQTEDANGFHNFVQDTDFLHKVNDPHFPHKGAGTHIPMWLTPDLAKHVMMKYGTSGHAIPHPNLKIFNK